MNKDDEYELPHYLKRDPFEHEDDDNAAPWWLCLGLAAFGVLVFVVGVICS